MKKIAFLLITIILIIFVVYSCYTPQSNEKEIKNTEPLDKPPLPGQIMIENVQSQSLTLKWTKAVDSTTLEQYLRYQALVSIDETIDTLEKANTAEWITDSTTDIYSVHLTDLTADLIYYFNVLVEDQGGNQVLYDNGAAIKTLAADDYIAPVPGNAGSLLFTNKQLAFINLNWIKAADDIWEEFDLDYKVIYSENDDINTVIDAENNGILMQDWTKNIETAVFFNPTSLLEMTYYCNILVRDQSGNKNIYNRFFLDYQTPSFTNNSLTVTNLLNNSLTLKWVKTTDNMTSQTNLEYKIIRSENNNIDTVLKAETNGQVLVNWTKNISAKNLSGIPSGTLYYYGVLVQDEQFNKSIYQSTYAFYDDFQDANYNSWTTVNPTYWKVVSDDTTPDIKLFKSHITNNSISSVALIGENAWSNYKMQSSIKFEWEAGLVFHYQDPNNYYYLMLQENKAILYKNKAGVLSELSVLIEPKILFDTWYQLTAEIHHNNINCTIKNTELDLNQSLTVTDLMDPLINGYAGVKNKGGDCYFDNINILKD